MLDMDALLAKLWRGELGLAKTFWGFAILGKVLIALCGLAVDHLTDSGRAMMWFASVEVGYGFLVAVAVFRASRHFAGRKAWAWLAVGWAWLTLALNAGGWTMMVVDAFQDAI